MKNHTGSVSALPTTIPQVCGSLRIAAYDSPAFADAAIGVARPVRMSARSSSPSRGCISGGR